MTIEALQNLALLLANQNYCRWWSHWNYPCQTPWQMALSIMDINGKAVEIPDLLNQGFSVNHCHGQTIYYIDRHDEEGNPFKSQY